jgi:hypothetical protein
MNEFWHSTGHESGELGDGSTTFGPRLVKVA